MIVIARKAHCSSAHISYGSMTHSHWLACVQVPAHAHAHTCQHVMYILELGEVLRACCMIKLYVVGDAVLTGEARQHQPQAGYMQEHPDIIDAHVV